MVYSKRMIRARLMICGVGLVVLTSCALTSSSSGTFGTDICLTNQTSGDTTKGLPVGSQGFNGTAVGQTVRTPLGADTVITKAKLGLYRAGWPNGQLTFRIQTDNGGSPSGVDVSAATVTTLAYTSNQTLLTSTFKTYHEYFDFDFGSDVTLTNDTVYWLLLRTSAAVNASTYVVWAGINGNPYTSGAAYYENMTTGSSVFTNAQVTAERDTVFALCTPSPTTTSTVAAVDSLSDDTALAEMPFPEPMPEPSQ